MKYTDSEIRKTIVELGNSGYDMGMNGRNLNRNVCDRAADMMSDMLKEISRLKNEMSYMNDQLAIGDRHEIGAW